MTATAAVRVSTIRYARAAIATRLGLPTHTGATTDWADLLRNGLPATEVTGQPALAITSQPHREIHGPHLGVLHIAGQVDAHLFNTLWPQYVNTVHSEVTT